MHALAGLLGRHLWDVILVVAVQRLFSTSGAGIGFGAVNTNSGTIPDAGSFGSALVQASGVLLRTLPLLGVREHIMTAQRHITAKRIVVAWAKRQQARDQVIQMMRNTADAGEAAASKTSFAAFGNLLLAPIAAALGSLAIQRRLTVPEHLMAPEYAGLSSRCLL